MNKLFMIIFFLYPYAYAQINQQYYFKKDIVYEIYNNPYLYLSNNISKINKNRFKKNIIDIKVLQMLIMPTFSKNEIHYLSNTKNLFEYFRFIEGINEMHRAKNVYSFSEGWYTKKLGYVTIHHQYDCLESYIKIASMSDGGASYSFGEGFAQLINKKQLFFIKMIKKMNFADKMCELMQVGAGKFKLTQETKQIYKDNFDKNDKTIIKILKCEKDFNNQ